MVLYIHVKFFSFRVEKLTLIYVGEVSNELNITIMYIIHTNIDMRKEKTHVH